MTQDERKLIEMALKALEVAKQHIWLGDKAGVEANIKAHQTIIFIKEALAQPEQEPVEIPDCGEAGHADGACGNRECLPSFRRNTTPPQRKPLTSQERDAKRWRFLMENSYDSESVTQFHVWEHSWEPHSQTGEPTEWKQRVRGIALIDFIDRAIEAAHGIKE